MSDMDIHEKEFKTLSELPDTRENRSALGGIITHLHIAHDNKVGDALVVKIYALRDARLGF